MKRKKLIFALWILVLSLVLMACGDVDATDPTYSSSDNEPDRVIVSDDVSEVPNEDPDLEVPELPPEASAPPDDEDPVGTDVPEKTEPVMPVLIPADSTFEVHFIDVGQGDCSLIMCDGKTMLIDGGESSASSKVYAYLKAHGIEYLDYIVATHAHSDHIGGLSGALNYAAVGTALCPVSEYDSETFSSFEKYLGKQGVQITIPKAGESFMLGSALIEVLSPQYDYDEPNDTSIVLKVSYGETSFLFTGDAERTAEADILAAGYDLSATVLKVGHHGSDTSTSYPFLREIIPKYAVIQVGKDNSYGHPTEDTMSRLRDADVTVYRNDLHGTIICSSDGQSVSFTTEKNETVQTNPTIPENQEPDDIGEYIGNKNSKKFHLPTCKNLPAEKNRVYISSRQEAIDYGFSPCGNCHP